MSSRAQRRAKSPAIRNKFNDIGVTGRKTGVRVAGNVLVDDDGLENVDEFYKQTTPQDKVEQAGKGRKSTQTLRTLVSPTPIRSTPNYDSLIGALDMLNDTERPDIDDEIATPVLVRTQHVQPDPTPAARAAARMASRRTTMAPSRMAVPEDEWVRSPKRGRRVTMAFAAHGRSPRSAKGAGSSQRDNDVEDGEVTDQAAEDPGELTSATVIEGEDALGSDELSAAEDGYGPADVFAAGGADEDAPDKASQDEISQDEGAEGNEVAGEADDDMDIAAPEPQSDLQEEDEAEAEVETEEEEDVDAEEDADEEARRPVPTRKQTATSAKRGSKKGQQPEQPARRSTRASVQPLAYWRNEHIEYEYARGAGNGVAVPKVKNIVRVRHTAEEKYQAKKRRVRQGTRLPSLRGIKVGELDLNDRNRFYYYDDENYGFPVQGDTTSKFGPKYVAPDKAQGSNKRTVDQFDDNDDIDVDSGAQLVLSPDGNAEHKLDVAISRRDIEWTEVGTKNDKYKVGVGLISGQPDGLARNAASGVLCLPVGGKKPPRSSSDSSMFFLVTSGKVEVHIHKTTFHVGALGQFLVPPRNLYTVANVGTHPAQLYYVQVAATPAAAEAASDSGSE